MSKSLLENYFSLERQGIVPALFPTEEFYYYTLPDFDKDRTAGVTQGHEIGSNKYIVKNGYILVSKLNPRIRRVWLINNDSQIRSVSSTEFVVAVPKDNVNKQYLYYYLFSDCIFPTLNAEAIGTTNSHVRFKPELLLKIPASFPTLAQQSKIGHILKTIDQTIEKTEALIEKYQQIKEGLMHDLFTRGVTADGKLRPTRDQAPELYQETPIGWIPKAWKYECLKGLKESLVDGPFGSNLKTEHYVIEQEVRVVRLQNIQATMYNDGDRAFVSAKHAITLLRNTVTNGDILIAGLGEEKYPVGRACLYPEDLPPAINKADCFRLRCDKVKILNPYLMYFLNTQSARKQVRKYEQGVTRPRINLGNMNKIAAPVPEVNEQQIIIARLDKAQTLIQSENSSLFKIQEQKRGLMKDLLTGKVPVEAEEQAAAHD